MATELQDPMAALVEHAKRVAAEEKAKTALSAAKVSLICGTAVPSRPGKDGKAKAMGASAFFTRLIIQPAYVPCWDIPTACTDGKTIRYNPSYVADNPKSVVIGLLAEEGGHAGFGHHVRMAQLAKVYGDDFDHDTANVAADLALLGLLKQAGFDIPADHCCLPGEGKYADMPVGESMEHYYGLLHKKRPKGGKGEIGRASCRERV